MDEYLASTLNKLNTNRYGELTLVIGNESCDLDSAVSSLVYSTFLYWQHNQIKCKLKRDESVYKDDIFVPILNIPRDDYELKTEVAFTFRKMGIYENHLVFRDDHDLEHLIKQSNTKIVLVDHHVLTKNDRFLAPYVTEIIDHRPIDKTEWPFKNDTRCTIELVGSCCSLVGQRIRELSRLLGKDVEFFKVLPVCGELLHRTIILDTVNFSKEVDKARAQDEDVVMFLESVLSPAHYDEDRKIKLLELLAARKDVSKLTPAQLLRKDVKIVGDVLIPSFPILVEDYLRLPGSLQAVLDALPKRHCTLAVLLGMNLSTNVTRDVAVISPEIPSKGPLVTDATSLQSLHSATSVVKGEC